MPNLRIFDAGNDLSTYADTWGRPLWHRGRHLVAIVKDEVVTGDDHLSGDIRLFREQDLEEWIVFTLVCTALLVFDHVVLHREQNVLSFRRSCSYTMFYILCAGMFNVYVYFSHGIENAYTWSTGYLLEWMLSLDNLFVFHLVFRIYATPDAQKHKPLFYGIIGAIVFRMIFFIIGQALFSMFWWAHLLFGSFLVYTGFRSLCVDDDEADPTKNPAVIWLADHLPILKTYDAEGRFFVHQKSDGDVGRRCGFNYKATMLFLVVICLEITDIIFAVDSVSAIVAQVPDLYLAYTACVFAMLGLRATYFVIDELIRMFSLLKYGVGLILVFIGAKLMASKHLHMSNGHVLLILLCTVAACIAASLVKDRVATRAEAMRSPTSSAQNPEETPIG